jgi:hypothetical protein
MKSLSIVIKQPFWKGIKRSFVGMAIASGLLVPVLEKHAVYAQTAAYCQLTNDAVNQKQQLREQAIRGDRNAQNQYKALLEQHAAQLNRCRNQTWPREQAVWLRLYPCDVRTGKLDQVFDEIVNQGYNRVYVEAFYDGQVLLPQAQNQTPWPSVIRQPGYENTDLLAQAIAKGRERGLEVYAWLFSMNFGYSYTQRPDRQNTLAVNGHGQTPSSINASASLSGAISNPSEEVFIDPYSQQAKQDYYLMAQAISQRNPDGMLFDYIRYPRGLGSASVVSRVQDLWIYGSSARQALVDRALNQKGRDLIQHFLNRGYITAGDIADVNSRYPDEGEPNWQGRTTLSSEPRTPSELQPLLQTELWQLSIAHAFQGVLDFLNVATLPAQQQNIPAGVVFFPEANATVGRGYDSRLQPWDRFPSYLEWHPMSYATCGGVGCIVNQVQRVLSAAPNGTQVKPVLAGVWGANMSNRPSLEAQMAALQRATPQVNSVSHFAFSWQNAELDQERKFCQFR